MFTDCPQCHTTFRVTAQLLRQARGQVRCGGCGHRFDALENLSEESAGDDLSSSQSVRIFEERSQALLKSMDDLAGKDNVTIEDTGVEWRVFDMDDINDEDSDGEEDAAAARVDVRVRWEDEPPSQAPTENGAVDDEAKLAPYDLPGEHAFDEQAEDSEWDSPGTEGFEVSETSANEIEAIDFDDVPQPEDDDEPAPQQSRDLQQREPAPAGDDGQLRFDDNTPLPDEFYRPVTVAETDQQPDSDDEPGAAAGQETLRVSIDTGTEADWQGLLSEVDKVAPSDAPAKSGDERPAARSEDDHHTAVAEVNPAAAVDNQTDNDVPAELTPAASDVNDLRDQEHKQHRERRQTVTDPHEYDIDDSLVESIVMEGDTVTDLLEFAERPSYDDIPPPEFDDDSILIAAVSEKDHGRRATTGVGLVAVLLLAITLAAQYLHTHREQFATEPWFQSLVSPIYELLGQPVAAAWDIRGWQFESTSGSTDGTDEHLTIYSRIANESELPLPYPLIHVSLTDRWDEVIGSRVLAPQDYLAGAGNPKQPVPTGASFAAVITIEAPAVDATGFKLNVCYPLPAERLRCAIEDFRE